MYAGKFRWMGGTCQNCYFLPAAVQKSFHAFRLWLLHISTQRSHHMYTVMHTSNTVNKKFLFVLLLCITVAYYQHVYEGKSQNQ